MHFVSQRWLGGMLTNFRTVRSRLQRLEQLEVMQENGTLDSESKKQASRLKREMRKISSNLGGVRQMSRLPGLVIVVDVRKEYLALHEARKLGIPTIGILDTNGDPDAVDIAIPANDDSIRAVSLLLNELADAVAIGKTMVDTRTEQVQHPRRSRSKRSVLAQAQTEPETVSTAKQEAAPETESQQPEPVAEQAEQASEQTEQPVEPAKED